MFQGLPITLLPVKVGNTSEDLENEIHQTIFFLYPTKEINSKGCNNTKNSINL